MKKLEIYLISSITDISVGSYRIWIKDLSEYLNSIGVAVTIGIPDKILPKNAVIILGKSDLRLLSFYKKKYPKNLVGIINPTGGKKYGADFIIVGSVEEKDSLSENKNVFIFPLIESSYSQIPRKIHYKKSDIVIGVHGSYTHLPKFRPNLKRALERLNDSVDVHLKVITNRNAPNWSYGKPKVHSLEIVDWSFDTFSSELLECDIGIVANISDITPKLKRTSKNLGLYNNDYFLRLKNKSNAGRVFVFIQHGIPVVADITPSNMHILANPDNGYAVFSSAGWLNAFVELQSFERRNYIAENALKAFHEHYDPKVWAKKLMENIQRVENYA